MGIGLYVHIPFCLAKCNYCDFLSYALKGENPPGQKDVAVYLSALMREARLYGGYLRRCPKRVETLYIGGGTPTCLTGGQLYRLLTYLGEEFRLLPGTETTVEANPGTLTKSKLRYLKEGGCTRLSLGAQSFNSDELKALGRIHTARAVFHTFETARKEGFTNIGLDLMYGLPGQDLRSWGQNLAQAVRLAPEHISLYQLKIEEKTPFSSLLAAGKIAEPDEELCCLMYELAIEKLTLAGYNHYEISNFALPGYECRHNKIYWLNKEYIGIGAGASGFLDSIRYTNTGCLEEYINRAAENERPVASRETIGRKLAMAETMFLGLRLCSGVEKKEFYRRYQVTVAEQYGCVIKKLKNQGLLAETRERVYLTSHGLPLANLVFMEFLPAFTAAQLPAAGD